MMHIKCLTFGLLLVPAGLSASDWPLMVFRGGVSAEEDFQQTLETIRRHKGSFDEYWVSLSHPWMGDAKIARILEKTSRWSNIIRAAGIRVGSQEGVTLGHGTPLIGGFTKGGEDCLTVPEDAYSLGRDGQQLMGCFCPRSPFVQAREEEYIEALCRAERPLTLWLDDDLRNGVWKPDGCFCDRCIKAFNAETGRQVTRQELAGRLFGGDEVDAIRGEWFAFNERSLALFAAAARRGANKVDPTIRLCLQSCSAAYFYSGDGRKRVLWELSDRGKQPSGIRCGSGYYTEAVPPRDLVRRLQHVMREAVRCRAYGDWMGTITYENDKYTHQVLNKTWEASLKENAYALAVGCDTLTMYWHTGRRAEPMACFDEFAEHLAAWRPYYERLSAVSSRTLPGGVARKRPGRFLDILPAAFRGKEAKYEKSLSVHYSHEHPMDLQFALFGLPVTVEEAHPQALYTPDDRWVGKGDDNNPTTSELEALRDLFDRRSNNTVPVRIGKAHPLVVLPRVDAAGRLVSVSFFNASMGRATRVPVRLRNPVGTQFEWMSGETKPQVLSSTAGSLPGERIVTMPDLPGFDIGTIFVNRL